jgi:CoA:oxalate CoA-transferase
VDIAMLDCTFALLEHGLMDALGIHKRPTRLGNRDPFAYPFDTFNCSDQALAIAVGNDHLFGILCKVLGLATLPADTRFATNVARCTNHAALKTTMESVLKTNTAATWRGRFEAKGVPVGIVLNVDDTRKLEQIAARGMVKNVGGHDVPGTPLKFSSYNSVGTMISAPTLDNRGTAIRAEFALQEVS